MLLSASPTLVHKTVHLEPGAYWAAFTMSRSRLRRISPGMCLHQESCLGLAGACRALQLRQSLERWSPYRSDGLETYVLKIIKCRRAFFRKLFSGTLSWGLETRAVKSVSVRGPAADWLSGNQGSLKSIFKG